MRSKVIGLLALLLLCAIGASAQQGNTVTIRFPGAPSGTCSSVMFAVRDDTAAFYDCTALGAWNAVAGGGGASPAAPDGSLQYNAGGGMFGAVPLLVAGNADCDGFMDPCSFYYDPNGAFNYLIFGTDSMGPMDNTFDLYEFLGWSMDYFDGTQGSNLTVASKSVSLSTGFGATYSGFQTKNDFLSVGFSRFMFIMPTDQTPTTANYALSAGWGNAATVDSTRGTDNNPKVQITSAGTGQGANPTVTFTYKNGAFGNTSNTPTYVCQMSDGTGVVADITHTETTTALTMIYNAIPVAGLTYVISCFGATAGYN